MKDHGLNWGNADKGKSIVHTERLGCAVFPTQNCKQAIAGRRSSGWQSSWGGIDREVLKSEPKPED